MVTAVSKFLLRQKVYSEEEDFMFFKKLLMTSAAAGTLLAISSPVMAQGYYVHPRHFVGPHFHVAPRYYPPPAYSTYAVPRYGYVTPDYISPFVDVSPTQVTSSPLAGCDPYNECGSVQQPMTQETIDVKEVRIKRTY